MTWSIQAIWGSCGLLALVNLVGCATLPEIDLRKKQEVVVDVVRPSQMEEGGCHNIHLVYVSPEQVLPASGVRLSASAKQMISEEIRRLLNETGYIKSTTIPAGITDFADHDLIVKITTFEVKSSQDEAYRRKTAYVDMSLVLKEDGAQECYSITPPVYEHIAQVPLYRDQTLPSDQTLLRQAVRHTLEDVVSTFVPQKVQTLRPIQGVSGDLARANDLLLAGNCLDALLLLEQHLGPNPKDTKALYNAGVAAECIATKERDQDRKQRALKASVDYYKQVLELGKADADMQRARKEALSTLEFYLRVTDSGTKQRQQRDEFKSPKGF